MNCLKIQRDHLRTVPYRTVYVFINTLYFVFFCFFLFLVPTSCDIKTDTTDTIAFKGKIKKIPYRKDPILKIQYWVLVLPVR